MVVTVAVLVATYSWTAIVSNTSVWPNGAWNIILGVIFVIGIFLYYQWFALLVVVAVNCLLAFTLRAKKNVYRWVLIPINFVSLWVIATSRLRSLSESFDGIPNDTTFGLSMMEPHSVLVALAGGIAAAWCWDVKLGRSK